MSAIIMKRAIRLVAASAIGAAMLLGPTGIANASTGVVGTHRTGIASCQTPDSVSMTVAAPTIKAVNATSSVDHQKVSFQPVIFKWNGSAWASTTTGMRLYGTASDTASPSTFYDWATGQNEGNGSQTFGLTTNGHYAVAVRMTWYDGSWNVTGSDYLWTGTYLSPIGAILPYCSR